MLKRMQRALKLGGDIYTLDDIGEEMHKGNMQGHVENGTWAVTRIHDWPQKRTVDIVFVVGNLEDSLELEGKVCNWAKDIGADMVTATGREGWWKYHTPGWNKMGVLYAKELKS